MAQYPRRQLLAAGLALTTFGLPGCAGQESDSAPEQTPDTNTVYMGVPQAFDHQISAEYPKTFSPAEPIIFNTSVTVTQTEQTNQSYRLASVELRLYEGEEQRDAWQSTSASLGTPIQKTLKASFREKAYQIHFTSIAKFATGGKITSHVWHEGAIGYPDRSL
ncbi:hypothetical protein SAMN05216388_103821 [Halorientalis persicus]|uniref:Uncharacterized protein n=1 Tax=Halorientalis persicus TaxID=1367881 RepID=A0A1H8VIU7_9EURY|nr:hypothetical protein [Halorientalis persicus]SEP15356.1 hypothetical protein SAMN05216388_103821 [Halorientalis persicus]